jgi:hypothetical protein
VKKKKENSRVYNPEDVKSLEGLKTQLLELSSKLDELKDAAIDHYSLIDEQLNSSKPKRNATELKRTFS